MQQNGNQLIYPTFGGFIKNPFRGSAKFFAGDLMWYKTDDNGVHPEVYILKTYEVVSASGATLNILNDGYKHKPFVGDKLGVAPAEIGGAMTAQTVIAVANATADGKNVWKVTFDGTITANKGDVLVEAGSDNKMLVKAINAVSPTDNDMLDAPATSDEDFDNARYSFTPALGGLMYTNKMSPLPACVKALNKSEVNGWFKVQAV